MPCVMFTDPQLMHKKLYILGAISFLLLGAMLIVDITMLTWYQSFYQSIQNKNQSQFFDNIIKFLFISGCSALATSALNYILELLDLEIKLMLSSIAINKLSENKRYTASNQRPIDDATLAAERLSSTMPMFIFNLIKILTLIALLVLWSPSTLDINIYGSNFIMPYPLLITSLVFITIQTIIATQYLPLLQRTDKLKRKVENKFRLTLLGLKNSKDIYGGLKTYLNSINTIRKHTAIKSFMLSVAIGLIGTFSYALPFIALFQFYTNDALNFGEIMKLSATFAFFQNACTYVVTNFRELFRGFAAVKRILS